MTSFPTTPKDEEGRLAALRRYDVLDTPPDGAFDRITALAARLLSVPISIISLVDTDRIWFKSHHGIDVDQIDREPGLCASAIVQNGAWVLPDASKDIRSLANPLVAGEFGLRFYAGVPLRTSDGHNLGTLCVIDREPREEVTQQEIGQLEELAAIVMDEMELRLAARQRHAEMAEAFAERDLQATRARDAEQRLNAVLNNASVAVFLMDDRQHCVYMNAAAERLTGYSFEETHGRPLHDVIHHTRPDGSHFPLCECAIDRAFPENHNVQGEEVFVHKDGSFYPVAYTASPVKDDEAKTIGTIIEVRGIQAEKEVQAALHEQRRQLETLNETGAAIAAELDLSRAVQLVTDAGVELTGARFGAFFYNMVDEAGESFMLYTLSGAERSDFERFGHPRATAVFKPTFEGEGVVRSDDITADFRYGKNPPHAGMPKGHLPVRSYAKAGSTFLQRWFEAHPQLAYREGGIAGFENVFQISHSAIRPKPGLLYRVTSSEGLSSPNPDASGGPVDYDRSYRASMEAEEREVFAMLSTLFPNAMILVITRGFRSMALSAYSQYLRSGGQSSLNNLIVRAGQEHPWHYDRLISMYRTGFGRERVIVMPFELLRDDPAAFCRHLEERLGLDRAHVSTARVNEALSPVELAWYPRLAAMAQRLPFRRSRGIGRAAYTNRLRLPIRILQKIQPIEPVTAAMITDEMLEAFRGQAESLRGNPLYEPYSNDYLL